MKIYGGPPNMKGYILEFTVPPLWPKYIVERRTTFAKSIGDKSEVLLGTLLL